MKTPEEIWEQVWDKNEKSLHVLIYKAIQEGSRQAVRVALEDAAENSKLIYQKYSTVIDKSSILSRESEILKKLGIDTKQ